MSWVKNQAAQCLMEWQQILLCVLPDGSRVNKLWLEWKLSVSILWALFRHLTSLISLMLGKWVPMMFHAVSSLWRSSQDAFYRSSVKVDKSCHGDVAIYHSFKKQRLFFVSFLFVCLFVFPQVGNMLRPWQILCDADSQEGKNVHLLFHSSTEVETCLCPPPAFFFF